MNNSTEKIIIVIPTYNEKENVGRLAQVLNDQVFSQLPKKYDPHILIVDDNSPDGTGKEVEVLKKKFLNLHLLTNPEKKGLGNAYVKGMRYAIDKLSADIVFEFDADFSHDPLKIPEMLVRLAGGADLVLGSRYITGGSIPDNWGMHRKFLSKVGNFVIRLVITNFSIHDWTTGYRAIRRHVLDKVLPEMDNETFMGYTFQIGLLHKTVRKGFRVAEVPIHFVDRTYGKSKLGAEYIKNTLSYIFRVRAGELARSRIVKFALIGALGSIIQLTCFQALRSLAGLTMANLIGIEIAIVSNFVLNNHWTFSDRKLEADKKLNKFLEFNLTSVGSIVMQTAIVFGGEKIVGLKTVGDLMGLTIDTGLIFAIIGIGLGMSWNYFAYNKLIWKKSN